MNSRAPFAFFAAGIVGLTLIAGAPEAQAQETPPPPVTLYPAPLSQQTQGTYVPQSVALSGPMELHEWKDGDPIPDGYHRVQRTRTGFISGGAALFGSLYFFSALTAAIGADANSGQSNPEAPLWIPGIGPFIQMAQTSSSVGNLFLAIDGIGQTAGLIMLVYGITTPKTSLVRNDLAQTKPKIVASPIVGKNMSGVGLLGTF